jgi:LPXTG-motif cell wall-anchored protein
MKRLILATSTMFLLTAGAAMAQSPLNTTAPGPTQQREPGQTNNALPNPGNPVPTPSTANPQPVTENGTVEGTATESIQRDETGTTTGTTTTGTMENTGTTTGTTTGSPYGSTTGTTPGSTTDVDVNDTTSGTTTTSSDTLPSTGSDVPMVGLIGLMALAGAVALRVSRRNA